MCYNSTTTPGLFPVFLKASKVQGKEILLDLTTFCKLFDLQNLRKDFEIDTKDEDLLEGVKQMYSGVCDTDKQDTPTDF